MTDHGTLIGTVPKTERAEVRIYRKWHKTRMIIDVRVWWLPDGQTEFVPSRKGAAFDASKAGLLVQALEAMP